MKPLVSRDVFHLPGGASKVIVTDSDATLLEAIIAAADEMRGEITCAMTRKPLPLPVPPAVSMTTGTLGGCGRCHGCNAARAYDEARGKVGQ